MDHEDNDLLFVMRKSRKAFFVEYFCGCVLLLIALFSYTLEMNFSPIIFRGIITLGLFSLVSAEFTRLLTTYKVGKVKITIISGLVKQSKKHVYFQPLAFIPDINVKQTRLQRLLGYGTIYIQSGGINTWEIRDIDSPHKVLEVIEKLVEENKRRMT